mgnify:CR=1 FL=1
MMDAPTRRLSTLPPTFDAWFFRSCAREPNDLKRMIPNDRPRFYHSGAVEKVLAASAD